MNSYRTKLKQKYPDCWQWISIARRISGQLTEEESSVLFHLALARTPSIEPVIVEVGPGQGKITLLLAAGLCDKIRPRLFCVQRDADDEPLRRNLRRCGLDHILAPTDANAAIDLLVIHREDDLASWAPFVKKSGIVLLHGCSPGAEERFQWPEYSDFRRMSAIAWAVKQTGAGHSEDAIEIATARLQDYIRRSIGEIAEDRHALEELRRSWSWRLTAPLRFGIEMLQAIAGLLGCLTQGSPKAAITGFAQWILFGRQVRASGLLDERYYRDSHPGVAWARTNPMLHFFVSGARERHRPNELFDMDYYLGRYPDVARAAVNPLVHYLRSGAYEGRDPHPHFSSSFYLDQNPDVRESRLNPLAHYLAPGIAEGRDPNPWFDTSEYLEQNLDVATFALNPLVHRLCSR